MRRLRWWLAKKISPYKTIALGLTIKDDVLAFPISTGGWIPAVVEGCTILRTNSNERVDNAKRIDLVRKLQERIQDADVIAMSILATVALSEIARGLVWDVHHALRAECSECGQWEQDGHTPDCKEGQAR